LHHCRGAPNSPPLRIGSDRWSAPAHGAVVAANFISEGIQR
jgi:hypothetical protein